MEFLIVAFSTVYTKVAKSMYVYWLYVTVQLYIAYTASLSWKFPKQSWEVAGEYAADYDSNGNRRHISK